MNKDREKAILEQLLRDKKVTVKDLASRLYASQPSTRRDLQPKILMAQRADELVKDGDVIFWDASSSAYALTPFLAGKSNLTVITSGIKALTARGEYGVNVHSTGGQLLATCQSLVGRDACQTVEKYNADLLFVSCRDISPEGYATDFSIEGNVVRQSMIKHTKRAVLLCAKEKIEKTYMHNLCHTDEVELISE